MAVSFTKMDEIPVDLTSLKRKTDKKSSREMCLREDPFFCAAFKAEEDSRFQNSLYA